jgi:hypothetical protein
MIKITSMMLVVGLIALGAVFFSGAAFARTYLYVDANGSVRSIEANTPAEAINNAPNRAMDSGVMTANFTPHLTGNTYLYVTSNGRVQTVVANNPIEAMAIASGIAIDSGVMLVD